MASTDPYTVDEAVELAGNDKLALDVEARQIALSYHRLAGQMAAYLGCDDVSWCGFAKWSSKAVGISLQLDDGSPVWKTIRTAFRLPGGLRFVIMRAILRSLLGSAYRRGLTVANRSIFVEMATFHVDLLEGRDTMTFKQAETSPAWHEHFRPLLLDTDVGHLENAARLLRRARTRRDPYLRSADILGASIELSAYEQFRAQPSLELVLYRPVRWLTLVWWRLPYLALFGWRWRRYEIYTRPHTAMPRFVRWLEHRWARMYTRALFLDLPTGPVNLGSDLQPPVGAPDDLMGPLPPDIQALVDQFQPSDAAIADHCWLDYTFRMSYIIRYFRAYQLVPALQQMPERPRRLVVRTRRRAQPNAFVGPAAEARLQAITSEPTDRTLHRCGANAPVTLCPARDPADDLSRRALS